MKKEYYHLLLTAAVAGVMAAVYFGLNQFAYLLDTYTGLALAFEQNIPLIPLFVPAYLTVYFIYLSPLFFVRSTHRYKKVLAAYLFVILVSGLVFLLFPTEMLWEPVACSSVANCLIPFLRTLDSPHNLIPSMHVSLAYLGSFVVFSEDKKWGFFLLVASTLIAVSTLLVRQHYAVDLIAGLMLSIMAYLFFVRRW